MKTKKCFKCGEINPLSEFYKHPQMGDGHLNKCKECTKKDARKHRKDNSEYCKEYDKKRAMLPHRVEARKEYSQTDKGKKVIYEADKRYKKNNKQKVKATRKIAYYLSKGYIEKKPCIICGDTKAHAHHPDYNYPLDVIWLCPKHHKEEHNRIRRLERE